MRSILLLVRSILLLVRSNLLLVRSILLLVRSILLLATLGACGGVESGLGSPSSDDAAAMDAAIQVELVASVAPPAGVRFDVWDAHGHSEPQATARLAADDAVLLRTPPGTWDVWATASWPIARDSGAPRESVQCSGLVDDVSVAASGTTVVRVDATCQRVRLD